MTTKKQLVLTQTALDTIEDFVGMKGSTNFQSNANEIIETFKYQLLYTKNELESIFNQEDIDALSAVVLGTTYNSIPLPKPFLSSLITSYKILNPQNDDSKLTKIESKLKSLSEFQAYVLMLLCTEHNVGKDKKKSPDRESSNTNSSTSHNN